MIILWDSKQYCWWKQLLLTAELHDKVCLLHCKALIGALMTRSLSDYSLRYAGIDLNILITRLYHCTKRVTLFLTVWRSITLLCFTLSHLKPVLQPSTPKTKVRLLFHNLLVHHDHALHTLFYPWSTLSQLKHLFTLVHYQNLECISMLIKHSAAPRALLTHSSYPMSGTAFVWVL